jgi:hypothetical protein
MYDPTWDLYFIAPLFPESPLRQVDLEFSEIVKSVEKFEFDIKNDDSFFEHEGILYKIVILLDLPWPFFEPV